MIPHDIDDASSTGDGDGIFLEATPVSEESDNKWQKKKEKKKQPFVFQDCMQLCWEQKSFSSVF